MIRQKYKGTDNKLPRARHSQQLDITSSNKDQYRESQNIEQE